MKKILDIAGEIIITAIILAVVTFYYIRTELDIHWTVPYILVVMLLFLFLYFRRKDKFDSLVPRIRINASYITWAFILFIALNAILLSIIWYRDVTNLHGREVFLPTIWSSAQVIALYIVYGGLVYFLGDIFVVKRLREGRSQLYKNALRFGFGFIVLSLFGYVISLLHVLSLQAYVILAASVLLIQYKKIHTAIISGLRKRYTFSLSSVSDFGRYAAIALVFIYAVFLFFNAYKIFAIDTDVFRSYYYVPKTLVEQGGMVEFAYDYMLHTGKGAEMLYLPLMYFEPYVVNFFMTFVFVLFIITAYFFISKLYSGNWAAFGIILITGIPALNIYAKSLKVEVFLMYSMLLIYYLFYYYLKERSIKTLMPVAVLCGYAIAVKYSALCVLPFMILVMFFYQMRSQSIKDIIQRVKHIVVLITIIIIAASPWLIHNTILYHNPVHPYFSVSNYLEDIYVKETGYHNLDFLSAWAQQRTIANIEYNTAPWYENLFLSVSGTSDRGMNNIGPFVLMLLVVIIYRCVWEKEYLLLLLIPVYISIWYQFALKSVWYMLYTIPLLYVLGINGIRSLSRNMRVFISTVIVCAATWCIVVQWSGLPWAYQFRTGELSLYDPYYLGSEDMKEVSEYINYILTENDSKYLMYSISFYKNIFVNDAYKHLIVDPSHQGISYIYNELQDIQRVKDFMIGHDINYILIPYKEYAEAQRNRKKYSEYSFFQQDTDMVHELITSSKMLFSNGTYYIFDIREPAREKAATDQV